MFVHMEGGCACGAVRYGLMAPSLFTHACHCTRCQKESGTAFAVHTIIETGAFELNGGDVVDHSVPTDGGALHRIARCRVCGTGLHSRYGQTPPMLYVKAGTLDRPGATPPQAHIFTSSKLLFVGLPADVPAFAEFYDRSTVWPESSIRRLRRSTLKGGSRGG